MTKNKILKDIDENISHGDLLRKLKKEFNNLFFKEFLVEESPWQDCLINYYFRLLDSSHKFFSMYEEHHIKLKNWQWRNYKDDEKLNQINVDFLEARENFIRDREEIINFLNKYYQFMGSNQAEHIKYNLDCDIAYKMAARSYSAGNLSRENRLKNTNWTSALAKTFLNKNKILSGLFLCFISTNFLFGSEDYSKESRSLVLPSSSHDIRAPNTTPKPESFVIFDIIEDIKHVVLKTRLTNEQIKLCFQEYDYVTDMFINSIRIYAQSTSE